MDIIKNLLSLFKEILYDVMTFVIPGLLLFSLLLLPIYMKECYSPMYSLNEILFTNKLQKYYYFILSLKSFSSIQIMILLFASYLLGHFLVYLSSILRKIYKCSFLEFICKPDTDYSAFCSNILKSLESNTKFNNNLFPKTNNVENNEYTKKRKNNRLVHKHELNSKNNDIYEKSIITFASTYSRFNSHNDLIQKYIHKINFYLSLSTLCLLIFIDSLISLILFSINSINTVTYLSFRIVLVLVSALFFFTFLSQYKKHNNLKKKECLIFLYDYFKDNNSTEIN